MNSLCSTPAQTNPDPRRQAPKTFFLLLLHRQSGIIVDVRDFDKLPLGEPSHSSSDNRHDLDPRYSQPTRRQFVVGAACALLGCACKRSEASLVQANASLLHPSKEALFYTKNHDHSIVCELCPRNCKVPHGGHGYCRVRVNRNGRYFSIVYNRPCAIHLDPIEKKPLFHVYPGTKAYSLGTVGCNLHCKFCQNWDIAQANPEEIPVPLKSPEAIAEAAFRQDARLLAFTYNEPTVFYEYMIDCAKAAAQRGIESVVISNGYMNDAPMKHLLPNVKAVKIDLKSFSPSFYRDICDGNRDPVLKTLKTIADAGTWLEIVCLLIPSLNDKDDEIQRLAAWVLKELGPNVPIHFTRYQPLYQLRNLPPTPAETLNRARQLAIKAGCRFVYTGNVPGLPGEDTPCYSCGKLLIRRYGYLIRENLIRDNRCPACHTIVPGIW